jgi:predicted Zn-dependent protease
MLARRSARVAVALALLAGVARPAAAQTIGDRLGRIVGGAARIVRTMLPISTDKEVEIGRGIAATIAGRYPIVQDSALTLYVNLVGLTVAGEQPRPDVTYRFAVLETPDVNAFAAPGGYIFVTRGALALMESEAELAGVLAHEVGHVNRRHVIEGIRKSDMMQTVRDESGLSGTTLDRAVGQGANAIFSGYSREDESEADSLGVEYAAGAGYDPQGLPRFVSHLNRHAGEGPLAEMFATHEAPDARLARLGRIIARDSLRGGVTLAERFAAHIHPNGAAQPAVAPLVKPATPATPSRPPARPLPPPTRRNKPKPPGG